jgi:acyl carrier protein
VSGEKELKKAEKNKSCDNFKDHSDGQLKSVLANSLGLETNLVVNFDRTTGLFGHLPELDSMAVASLLTGIEDSFDIVIEDDDVDIEILETFGALHDFIIRKLKEN